MKIVISARQPKIDRHAHAQTHTHTYAGTCVCVRVLMVLKNYQAAGDASQVFKIANVIFTCLA